MLLVPAVDLKDGLLTNAIAVDERGASVPDAAVWTAASAAGVNAGSACNNWENVGGTAPIGLTSRKDEGWSSHRIDEPCATLARVYCFEPITASYEKLLAATGMQKNVRCFNVALGAAAGTVAMT